MLVQECNTWGLSSMFAHKNGCVCTMWVSILRFPSEKPKVDSHKPVYDISDEGIANYPLWVIEILGRFCDLHDTDLFQIWRIFTCLTKICLLSRSADTLPIIYWGSKKQELYQMLVYRRSFGFCKIKSDLACRDVSSWVDRQKEAVISWKRRRRASLSNVNGRALMWYFMI